MIVYCVWVEPTPKFLKRANWKAGYVPRHPAWMPSPDGLPRIYENEKNARAAVRQWDSTDFTCEIREFSLKPAIVLQDHPNPRIGP